jgi:hypothetical protein
MSHQKRILKRLSILYGVMKEMRFIEMRRQLVLLDEAEQAIAAQETAVWTVEKAGRGALQEGDLLGWRQARTQAALAEWNSGQLETLRQERGELYEAALEQYGESRIQSEQTDQLLEDVTRQLELEEQRRNQAIADDRYLGRKLWMEMHAKALAEKTSKG